MSLVEKIQNTSTSLFVLIGLAVGGLMYWNDMDTIEAKDRQIETKKNEVQLAEEAIQEKRQKKSPATKLSLNSKAIRWPNSLKQQWSSCQINSTNKMYYKKSLTKRDPQVLTPRISNPKNLS